jgi:RNA polymerase sigma factor (sigma-70 family)
MRRVAFESGPVGRNCYKAEDHSESAKSELIVAAATREANRACAGLSARRQEFIRSTVFHITRNREDAEDAMQDAWMKAFIHRDTFEGRAAFATWFTRIAINCALMIIRKRRGRIELSLSDGPSDETSGSPPIVEPSLGPEEQCLRREEVEAVRQAMNRLPASLGAVIEFQYTHEMSIQEIAANMGISIPAAKSRLSRAKLRLREPLSIGLAVKGSSRPSGSTGLCK